MAVHSSLGKIVITMLKTMRGHDTFGQKIQSFLSKLKIVCRSESEDSEEHNPPPGASSFPLLVV